MMKNKALRLRLTILSFLEFAVWGAYLISLGRYLGIIGLGPQIKWFFAMQGIVSLFMPALIGIVADRYIQAQRVLSLCHFIAGFFMIAASLYCMKSAGHIQFTPLFLLYSISLAFFMPTIALSNSVAYQALASAGIDTISAFPPIRAFGTVGFICSMLLTNWLRIDGIPMQDSFTQMTASGVFSLILCAFSLTLPECHVNRHAEKKSLIDTFGLRAFTLFKNYRMAVFFIFAMLLGSALQITNAYANTFLGSFGENPIYADAFAVRNSNALLAISQASETLCILLIPFFMHRLGIKKVMLIAMVAWVLRFGLFAIGKPDMPGVIWLIISCIVYGVAFDFFNISGSMFVDQSVGKNIRSSAQGLFMMMTNGFGASIGTLAAGAVIDKFVYEAVNPSWPTAWMIFAGYALAVTIAFALIFKDTKQPE